jgi:hypothetical protein
VEANLMIDDEIRIIRRARHEISAEFGHDVDRVVDYYRSIEEELKHSGQFRFAADAAGLEQSDVPKAVTKSSNVEHSSARPR